METATCLGWPLVIKSPTMHINTRWKQVLRHPSVSHRKPNERIWEPQAQANNSRSPVNPTSNGTYILGHSLLCMGDRWLHNVIQIDTLTHRYSLFLTEVCVVEFYDCRKWSVAAARPSVSHNALQLCNHKSCYLLTPLISSCFFLPEITF